MLQENLKSQISEEKNSQHLIDQLSELNEVQ